MLPNYFMATFFESGMDYKLQSADVQSSDGLKSCLKMVGYQYYITHMATGSLQWYHNERDVVSNHQPHDCLLNCLFRRRSKKTSKLHATGLCAGNSPVTGEFPAQMASNVENVSIWWNHHVGWQFCDNIMVMISLLMRMVFSGNILWKWDGFSTAICWCPIFRWV